jgi:hypothetical protein
MVLIETGTRSDGSSDTVVVKQLTSAIPSLITMFPESHVDAKENVKPNMVGEQEQMSLVPVICAFTPDTAIARAKKATCTYLSKYEYLVATRRRGTDPLLAIPGDSRVDIVPVVCSAFYQKQAMEPFRAMGGL